MSTFKIDKVQPKTFAATLKSRERESEGVSKKYRIVKFCHFYRVENTELRKLLRSSNRCNHTNNLFKDKQESANRFISSSCKGQRLSIKVRSISSHSPSYLSQQFIVAINEGREGGFKGRK